MQKYLRDFTFNSGAQDEVIVQAETELSFRLPPEYVSFLKLCDGGEGFIGGSYVILWKIEELCSMKDAYEVEKYAPGLLIFGSDGGGEAYGFDTRHPGSQIVQVPFIGMNWKVARLIATSFEDFLEHLNSQGL